MDSIFLQNEVSKVLGEEPSVVDHVPHLYFVTSVLQIIIAPDIVGITDGTLGCRVDFLIRKKQSV